MITYVSETDCPFIVAGNSTLESVELCHRPSVVYCYQCGMEGCMPHLLEMECMETKSGKHQIEWIDDHQKIYLTKPEQRRQLLLSCRDGIALALFLLCVCWGIALWVNG